MNAFTLLLLLARKYHCHLNNYVFFYWIKKETEDRSLQWRLQLRAKVQMAPFARLRSGQRLQGHLYGLVPLPVLLRLQVSAAINKGPHCVFYPSQY